MLKRNDLIKFLLILVPGIAIINGVVSIFVFRPVDILLIVGYVLVFSYNARLPRSSIVLIFLGILWLIVSLLAPISEQQFIGIERNIRFFEGFLWFPLALIAYRSEGRSNGLIIGAAAMALSSLMVYVLHPDYQRFAGFFSSAGGEGLSYQASFNEWGAIFSITGVAILIKILVFEKYNQLFPLLLVISGLYLTQSRSSVVAFILGGFLISVYRATVDAHRQRLTWSSCLILASPIILLLVYNYVSGKLALNRFTESFQHGSNAEVSASTRLQMWDSAQRIWLDDPSSILFGVGNNRFQNIMGGATSDSFYLDHLGIYGIVALGIYFCYLIYIVYLSKNKILSSIILLVILFIGLTGNVLSDPIVFSTIALTFLWIGYEKNKT